jgi:hypothetical protein
VLTHQESGDDELVHGRTQSGPGDTELGTERALGGDGVTGAAFLDELEDRVADSFALEDRAGGGGIDLHAGLSFVVDTANWYAF